MPRLLPRISGGYALGSGDFAGEPFELRENLVVCVYFDQTNEAGDVIVSAGIGGIGQGEAARRFGLVIDPAGTAIPAEWIVPYRVHLLQWLPTPRRWWIRGVGRRSMTQAEVLALLTDGSVPWGPVAKPGGGIQPTDIALSALALEAAFGISLRSNPALRLANWVGDLPASRVSGLSSSSWTTRVFTSSGTMTATAREWEITLAGAGGGGSGGGNRSPAGGSGGDSTLRVGSTTFTIKGGVGGPANNRSGPALPTPPSLPTLSGAAPFYTTGRGQSGGAGGRERFSVGEQDGSSGYAGDLLELYYDRGTAASTTLTLTLGAGGAGSAGQDTRGAAGAAARARVRYR